MTIGGEQSPANFYKFWLLWLLCMSEDLLERLERLMLIYERTQEMELKKAEIAAKTASDILAQNRKSQLELITYFNQFVNVSTPITKKEEET